MRGTWRRFFKYFFHSLINCTADIWGIPRYFAMWNVNSNDPSAELHDKLLTQFWRCSVVTCQLLVINQSGESERFIRRLNSVRWYLINGIPISNQWRISELSCFAVPVVGSEGGKMMNFSLRFNWVIRTMAKLVLIEIHSFSFSFPY